MAHLEIRKSAVLSPCQKYRYELRRVWDDTRPLVNFIGLNPSKANAEVDDPTTIRCINFARDWGYGGMVFTNLFAYRATKPQDMARFPFPDGPENWDYLKRNAIEAKIVVAAWTTHRKARERQPRVRELLANHGVSLHYLRLTEAGTPEHPLYLPASLKPVLWEKIS